MNNLAHGLEMSRECLLPQVFEYTEYQNQSLAYLRGKGSTFSPPDTDPTGGACGAYWDLHQRQRCVPQWLVPGPRSTVTRYVG